MSEPASSPRFGLIIIFCFLVVAIATVVSSWAVKREPSDDDVRAYMAKQNAWEQPERARGQEFRWRWRSTPESEHARLDFAEVAVNPVLWDFVDHAVLHGEKRRWSWGDGVWVCGATNGTMTWTITSKSASYWSASPASCTADVSPAYWIQSGPPASGSGGYP